MFIKKLYKENDIKDNIRQLLDELAEFASKADTNTALYANAANHLKNYFTSGANWVGFYLVNAENNLDLGPFNGLPAVTFIENTKGVCGTCLSRKQTIVIDDVCNEPNHITCDINSKSEICVPVFVNNNMVALLDLDSPMLSYTSKYKDLLEVYISALAKYLRYEAEEVIYVAGGCFWGVQEYFSRIKGVLKTSVGYANSSLKFPTYKDICNGVSDGVEAVQVVFDKNVISYQEIFAYLYAVINPIAINKQGEDEGTQYRTGIYWNNKKQEEEIKKSLDKLQLSFKEEVKVENLPLTNYYLAEDYHQDYLKKNPNGYCHIKF